MEENFRKYGIPEDIWNKMSLEDKCRGRELEVCKEIVIKDFWKVWKENEKLGLVFWSLVLLLDIMFWIGFYFFVQILF